MDISKDSPEYKNLKKICINEILRAFEKSNLPLATILKKIKTTNMTEMALANAILLSGMVLDEVIDDLGDRSDEASLKYLRQQTKYRRARSTKRKRQDDNDDAKQDNYNNEYHDEEDDDDDDEDDEEEVANAKLSKQFKKQLFKRPINEWTYFSKLSNDAKQDTLDKISTIETSTVDEKPLIFRTIESKMSNSNKMAVMKRITQLRSLEPMSGEHTKLMNWINGIMEIPFGALQVEPVVKTDSKKKITKYLDASKATLDASIYGQDDAKREIMHILAQKISNPSATGNAFAIYGPPGVGKTSLIQNGLSKVMNRPYSFISLGGKTDSSTLTGHSYTYEGSQPGLIVNLLKKAQCMNPIIFFDELDKISTTSKGDEIKNVLMHLTDSSQNEKFQDEYYAGMTFDLSKAIMVFSYNDPSKVDPILLDRLTNVRMGGFTPVDKLTIATKYLLPNVLTETGFSPHDIKFSNTVIESLIHQYTCEAGVRKLKELLTEIIMELNLRKYRAKKMKFPYTITSKTIQQDILKDRYRTTHQRTHEKPIVGVINGLYASIDGLGGLTTVETNHYPSSSQAFDLLLTGMQGKVMQESMKVAKTVAWNLVPVEVQDRYRLNWKNNSYQGIHIHVPEGATPKDGPSAGAAITTALVSLMTGLPIDNKLALTGEIDLNGKVHEIGGLSDKLHGAKMAGITHALVPRENKNCLDKIKRKSPLLLDGTFKVTMVDTIWQVMDYALMMHGQTLEVMMDNAGDKVATSINPSNTSNTRHQKKSASRKSQRLK